MAAKVLTFPVAWPAIAVSVAPVAVTRHESAPCPRMDKKGKPCRVTFDSTIEWPREPTAEDLKFGEAKVRSMMMNHDRDAHGVEWGLL